MRFDFSKRNLSLILGILSTILLLTGAIIWLKTNNDSNDYMHASKDLKGAPIYDIKDGDSRAITVEKALNSIYAIGKGDKEKLRYYPVNFGIDDPRFILVEAPEEYFERFDKVVAAGNYGRNLLTMSVTPEEQEVSFSVRGKIVKNTPEIQKQLDQLIELIYENDPNSLNDYAGMFCDCYLQIMEEKNYSSRMKIGLWMTILGLVFAGIGYGGYVYIGKMEMKKRIHKLAKYGADGIYENPDRQVNGRKR